MSLCSGGVACSDAGVLRHQLASAPLLTRPVMLPTHRGHDLEHEHGCTCSETLVAPCPSSPLARPATPPSAEGEHSSCFELFAPVCATAANKTYANDCFAGIAGVTKYTKGKDIAVGMSRTRVLGVPCGYPHRCRRKALHYPRPQPTPGT